MTASAHLKYVLVAASVLFAACSQQAGDVCQNYGGGLGSDCGEGLECCGETNTCMSEGRGICVAQGTCMEPVVTCDDGGAVSEDAGSEDAGSEDAGSEDAGSEDAGSEDAGPEDAGSEDAGSEDAGPEDAGPEDAGPEDAGPEDAGPEVDSGSGS